jgi:hypothetical protein
MDRLMEMARKIASGMLSRTELTNASGLVPGGRSRDSIGTEVSGNGRGIGVVWGSGSLR